jgi:hypothetical protein
VSRVRWSSARQGDALFDFGVACLELKFFSNIIIFFLSFFELRQSWINMLIPIFIFLKKIHGTMQTLIAHAYSPYERITNQIRVRYQTWYVFLHLTCMDQALDID